MSLWKLFTRLFVLVLVLSGLFLGFLLFLNYTEKTSSTAEQVDIMNETATSQIDSYLSDMKSLSMLPISDFENFAQFNLPRSERNNTRVSQNFSSMAYSMMSLKTNISSVFLFNMAGDFEYKARGGSISGGYSPLADNWYKAACEADGRAVIIDTIHMPLMTRAASRLSFSVARQVYEFGDYDNRSVLLINSNLSFFESTLERVRVTDGQRFLVVGSGGNIIYGKNSETIGARCQSLISRERQVLGSRIVTMEDGEYLLREKSCNEGEWTLLNLVPYSYVVQSTLHSNMLNALFFLILLLLWFLTMLLIRGLVMRPIHRLSAAIAMRGAGDKKVIISHRRKDEIGALIDSFNNYIVRVEELTNRETKTRLREQQLEFQILQEQINPHFLYNTLESIRMLAIVNDDHEVAEITYNLGAVTRYSTSKANQLVLLQEDLAVIELYTKIQAKCYGKRFKIEINANEDVRREKVLKFLIQPVLENAILHGMKNVSQGGSIRIAAKRVGGEIHIEVCDNGCGIPPDILTDLRRHLKDEKAVWEHIGLLNVNNRIDIYYGSGYGLSVESREGEGTSILIRIPII